MKKPLANQQLIRSRSPQKSIWAVIISALFLLSWVGVYPVEADRNLVPGNQALTSERRSSKPTMDVGAFDQLTCLLNSYTPYGYEYQPVECLTASKGTSKFYVNLIWLERLEAISYLILRRGELGGWVKIEGSHPNSTYNDSDARRGQIYEYCVFALLVDKKLFSPNIGSVQLDRPQDYGYKQYRIQAQLRLESQLTIPEADEITIPSPSLPATRPTGSIHKNDLSTGVSGSLGQLETPQPSATIRDLTDGKVIWLTWTSVREADWHEIQLLKKSEEPEAGALVCLSDTCAFTTTKNIFEWQPPAEDGRYYLGIKARSGSGASPYSDWYVITVRKDHSDRTRALEIQPMGNPWKKETPTNDPPGLIAGTSRISQEADASWWFPETVTLFPGYKPIRKVVHEVHVGDSIRLVIPPEEITTGIDSIIWQAPGVISRQILPGSKVSEWEIQAKQSLHISANVYLQNGELRPYLFVIYARKDTRFPVIVANSFSPGLEGRDEVFYIRSNDQPVQQLIEYFRIRDLQNELIFVAEQAVTDDPESGWNGKKNGQVLPAGEYLYEAEILDEYGHQHLLLGVVELKR